MILLKFLCLYLVTLLFVFSKILLAFVYDGYDDYGYDGYGYDGYDDLTNFLSDDVLVDVINVPYDHDDDRDDHDD